MDRGRLVKTRLFRDPKYVGDPINAIKIFNDKEVDEIFVLDISVSRFGRGPDFQMVAEFAGECFMPLGYGGGIRNLEDARKLFSLGVEKVCIQSAAIESPEVIHQISDTFGSQSVVVSVDVRRNWRKKPILYNGSRRLGIDIPWSEFLCSNVEAGAGEVLLNAVHCDGLMRGMDLSLIEEAGRLVDVPIVAAGGVGNLADIREATDNGASAVAVGSFFVFHGPHRAVLITYPEYSTLERLFA